MNEDAATLIRVIRKELDLGEFYLSFIELMLKTDDFRSDDFGAYGEAGERKPLSALVKELRLRNGKKILASSSQRSYLRSLKVPIWRGMSNREASSLIDSIHYRYEVIPGDWIHEPSSKAQADLLEMLGCDYKSIWTKGEASLVISRRLIDRINC